MVYAPALNGQFVFDDLVLPFRSPIKDSPLGSWVSTVRPVLMFSYWVNYQLSGESPFAYHFSNLLIHLANTGLVFLVILRILAFAGWKRSQSVSASAAGSLLFLVHPLQTESVSYIAGRSESLSSFFLLLAYAVFLYWRRESISWLPAVCVILLFGLGVGTKENAVSLAGILVLTDLFWTENSSLRRSPKNWRLYVLMAPAAIAAVVAILWMLAGAPTAGFSVSTARWYQYAFTETRAILTYIGMALFPFGQSLDHDFPVSHTLLEHGALFSILAIAALIVYAIRVRRRLPLFSFGVFMFLVWLAPTSSIIPIDDPLVERRMYLPLLGLILAGLGLLARLTISRTVGYCLLAGLGLFFGSVCYARNLLWGEPERLLALAAIQSSTNPRPMLNLTEILIRHNRCDLAVPYLLRAERILGPTYYVDVSWGRTLACLNHDEEALQRLLLAGRLHPESQVFEWIGLLYGKIGRSNEAGAALRKAVALNPVSPSAHASLGLWYTSVHELAEAEREYGTAVSLDHNDLSARFALMRVRQSRIAAR